MIFSILWAIELSTGGVTLVNSMITGMFLLFVAMVPFIFQAWRDSKKTLHLAENRLAGDFAKKEEMEALFDLTVAGFKAINGRLDRISKTK